MQICLLAEAFVRSLESLKQGETITPPSHGVHKTEGSTQPQTVLQRTLHLQAQFQEILEVTTADDMDPQVEARLRPLQTEAHRRLRLLTIEATRLQTAKQPVTLEKSRSQFNAHLDALLQFAQGIANEVCA